MADQSRALAEESREKVWAGQSFLRDVFLGKFRLDLLESLELDVVVRREFCDFYEALETFLRDRVDPVEIDATGEYPRDVIDGLAELGAFGMKIPADYGGLGLSHPEYVKTMEMLGSYDANVTALLSAHQAIGVPQPIKLFGTDEQRQRFLPRCAAGAISAFALTEPAVGSDPSQLATRATRSDDGQSYVLDGVKLWCTNGTLAELIVVMARHPDTDQISAFVVEMDTPGVDVEHRCHFMGLKALANAYIRLDGARVPVENRIGDEGDGLKIALITLNTGRLSLPAATAGMAKRCTEIVRKWSSVREQWGSPIGKHEAIAHMNADIASTTFAMDAIARVVGELADRTDVDIRLEAAAAKEWNTVAAWRLIDETLQVRGGRGYETERSLAARGEPAIGVERMMRDARINLIFEGSSEIMHLFIAREAVDRHLEIAGDLIDPEASTGARLATFAKAAGYYALWYPSRWIGRSLWPFYRRYGALGRHLRFADRAARKLARSIFYGMLVHRARLEKKQAFLFRCVDIGLEIFAIAASVCRAQRLVDKRSEQAPAAVELADLAARVSRRRIADRFRGLWRNDDALAYHVGRQLIDGEYRALESGAMNLELSAGDLEPEPTRELVRKAS